MVTGVRGFFKGEDAELSSYVESDDMAALSGVKTSLSKRQQVQGRIMPGDNTGTGGRTGAGH